MANSNAWGDGAGNNAIGWGQGANNNIGWGDSHAKSWAGLTDIVGIDADAQAFITAAAITDPVQINAINTLVEGMKTDGIWTKMKAIYPFVGGTASTHKWNLKDPRDLDAAFRLVFNGGWTHSSTGALPNGTNGYADTKFNALNNFNATSRHMSFYNRTNTAKGYDMGCLLSANDTMLASRYTATTSAYTCYGTSAGGYTTAVTPTAVGFIQSSNISNSEKLYKNGSSVATRTRTITNINLPIFLGAANFNSVAIEYTDHQCAFSSIGDGLTDTEAANLYTRVQAYQTALNRQV
jgi:hypothetical protein